MASKVFRMRNSLSCAKARRKICIIAPNPILELVRTIAQYQDVYQRLNIVTNL
jgi:hypothetical protein